MQSILQEAYLGNIWLDFCPSIYATTMLIFDFAVPDLVWNSMAMNFSPYTSIAFMNQLIRKIQIEFQVPEFTGIIETKLLIPPISRKYKHQI